MKQSIIEIERTIIKLTTLMTFIFIRIIETIIVSIADINSRNAVAVITSEQIAETCSPLGLAVTRRFVASIQAIIISIAIPSSWNAPTYNRRYIFCIKASLNDL